MPFLATQTHTLSPKTTIEPFTAVLSRHLKSLGMAKSDRLRGSFIQGGLLFRRAWRTGSTEGPRTGKMLLYLLPTIGMDELFGITREISYAS